MPAVDGTEKLLTETGSGGLFGSGYLHAEPLVEYLQDAEEVSFVFSNTKKGVHEQAGDEQRAHTPGDNYRAMAAITDTRVLFAVGDATGDELFGVPYTEIESVTANQGMLKGSFEVSTTSGARWRFAVASSTDIEAAVAYIDRAAVVWSRVENQLQRARNQLDASRDHARADNHDPARAAAETAREYVQQATDKATELTEDRSSALWQRIELTTTRLEDHLLELHRTGGERSVERARRQWRQTAYEAAYDAYLQARSQYERAAEIAGDRHEVGDIRTEIAAVSDEIDRLSSAPLRQAQQAHERGQSADHPTTRIALLTEALDGYRSALLLDWGRDERRFAGDTDGIRAAIDDIAGAIIGTRRELATKRWRAGNWYCDRQRMARANTEYTNARDQLSQARSIAAELKPGLVSTLEADIDDLTTLIERTADTV